jgi:hypothetical protein
MLEVVSSAEARSNLFLDIIQIIMDGISNIRAIICGAL